MVAWVALALQISLETPQGGVIRIAGAPSKAVSAALAKGPVVKLFPAPDGTMGGLVPVSHDVAPGAVALTLRSQSGEVIQTTNVAVRSAHFLVQNIKATKSMKSLKPAPGEMEAMRALNLTVTDTRHFGETLAAPAPHCVNSPFGVTRLHNGKPSGNYHRGLDQASPASWPIRAAADGRVKVAQAWVMHGGTVGIDHGQGLTTHYLHMSKIIATEGQMVKKGDVIGEVGATGFATGPHLHWGLYLFGVPLNPRLWVPELKSCPGKP
jgi:murein DD-endopeptidase MepM/ murein hydrolase activator NlpD